MTDKAKVEVELHDVDNDIVEEALEEASAPATKGDAKDASPVTEPESLDSVQKAAKSTSKVAPPKTKAGMISAMVNKMQGLSKEEMKKLHASYHENMDYSEEEVVAEESIDTTAELDALVESEATLSDEFKQKTAVIFEAAVKSKLSEEVDRLESQYKAELSEEVTNIRSELVEKVDSYLNYVVETWMEDNKVAVQAGLRTEIAETFMEKMKDLFVESYIEVPESKVDLVDELATSVEELEAKLNEQVAETLALSEKLEVAQREQIVRDATRDLAESQVEKLKELIEKIDFEDEESFTAKVKTVKESFFAKEVTESVEEIVEEEAEDTVEVSSSMASYLSAIRKTAPKQ
jgi:hypothetical protein